MERVAVRPENAPPAAGPYSHGVAIGGLLFVSGQLAVDPASGNLIEGDIAAMTRQIFQNMEQILVAGGSSLANLVKTTVFLADMNDFQAMNAAYAEFFSADPPARSTIQVAALPRNARIEIEAIAAIM